jgi:hypothetical protein
MGSFSINTKFAPKKWSEFKRWHKAACPTDPLSAEERYKEMGYKIDGHKKVSRKSKGV